jgi:hypothetical protein
MGELSDPEDGKALQNFMICAEMAVAGFALLYAFPHKEYQIGGSAAGFRASAFVHAISIKDVVSDTIHVVRGAAVLNALAHQWNGCNSARHIACRCHC